MNVRKLKHDIWEQLDTKLIDPQDSQNAENCHPNQLTSPVSDMLRKNSVKTSCLSFKSMVADMSINQTQKEATLPFYFICLLHLANEKVTTSINLSLYLCKLNPTLNRF